MECDWEVEIGGDSPVIEAAWPGFVDLRQVPALVHQLSEAVQFPMLAPVLQELNSHDSPVWTSKCDVWTALSTADFDADELDASGEGCSSGMACYIDMLPRTNLQSNPVQIVESLCKPWCRRLRETPMRCCRVDFIVRKAAHADSSPPFSTHAFHSLNLGITAYITACGHTPAQTQAVLGSALATLAQSLCPDSKLQ